MIICSTDLSNLKTGDYYGSKVFEPGGFDYFNRSEKILQ